MLPETLREIGEALWGLHWQSEMARTLKVADRTVRRWAAGEFRIPVALEIELVPILRQRRETLGELLKKLR